MKKILLLSALVGSFCLLNKANAQEGYYQNQNNYNQQAYNNQPNYNNEQQAYYGSGANCNNTYAAYNRGLSYRSSARSSFMYDELHSGRYADGFNRGGRSGNDHRAYAANFERRNYNGNGGERHGRNFGGGQMIEQHNSNGNGGGRGFEGSHNFGGGFQGHRR